MSSFCVRDLYHRRGKWMQADADSSVYEVVATADWCHLAARHAPAEADHTRLVFLTSILVKMDKSWLPKARRTL